MTDGKALEVSRAKKAAVAKLGGTYRGGSYGKTTSKAGAPFEFEHTYLLDGERFEIKFSKLAE